MILYPAVSKKNVITYNMNNDTSDIVFLKWTVHAENIWRATFYKIKLVQIATSKRFVITPGRSKARYVSPGGDPYHFFFSWKSACTPNDTDYIIRDAEQLPKS